MDIESYQKPSESYEDKLAEKLLEINAIKLSPDKPFKWASGYRMPIYNDNRLLLGSYKNRMLVKEALSSMINEKPDLIAGTMSAGIPHATSLAYDQDLDVSIIYKDKPLVFEKDLIIQLSLIGNLIDDDTEIIAATSPFAIIPGVRVANIKGLPFVYIRNRPKSHGLEQQIEGVLKPGDKVHLINYFLDDNYLKEAIKAILDRGAEVVSFNSRTIEDDIKNYNHNIEGRKVLCIEDLVSTGGSIIKEIEIYREHGASVSDCLSIFSYNFPSTLKKFQEINCNLKSILGYEKLIETALKKNYIKQTHLNLLNEWRRDPFNWAEKYL